jgi:hypothetical protein
MYDEIFKDDDDYYGDIEHISMEKYAIEGQKLSTLGGTSSLVGCKAVMRYVAGCIKRERERLAKIAIKHENGEQLARAILDSSFDDLVFKWSPSETRLSTVPKSFEDGQLDLDSE